MDIRSDRLARLLTNYCVEVRPGAWVLIRAGYPETGSRNRSSVHWDFICDMRHDSEIWVDGELFYKNGRFSELILG